jgi:hypothetical protein
MEIGASLRVIGSGTGRRTCLVNAAVNSTGASHARLGCTWVIAMPEEEIDKSRPCWKYLDDFAVCNSTHLRTRVACDTGFFTTRALLMHLGNLRHRICRRPKTFSGLFCAGAFVQVQHYYVSGGDLLDCSKKYRLLTACLAENAPLISKVLI